MVKQAMKKYKSDATLTKVLDYRQMGLKLIANVTFGYTAANYSGRMPLVELGDSIVGRSSKYELGVDGLVNLACMRVSVVPSVFISSNGR